MQIVTEHTETSFKLENTVSGGTLTNGNTYLAEIASIDSTGTQSVYSDKILFYCYSTPSFSFSNIVNEQVINGSNLVCNILYSQSQDELLNSYKVSLYDLSKTVLSTSGIIYDTSTLAYTIGGLLDNSQYYVRAEGTTLHGMSVDTGYILISVNYITPTTYATVQLENVYRQGTVKLTCNVVSINGKSVPETPTYIEGTKVDLTALNSNVVYDEGFSFGNSNGDFSIELLIQNPTVFSTVFECSDGTNTISVKYCENQFVGDDVVSGYFILSATNSIVEYRIASNHISQLTDSDQVYLLLQRKNGLYDLYAKLKT